MPGEKQSLKDLKQCMKKANGDPVKMAACEANFGADPEGTTEGGKVFSTTDGNAAFVTTNGGKVFGGKVF